ncbi:MAG: class I SAM-dependent methyltransferase, partial [Acidobacteriota bacterium]
MEFHVMDAADLKFVDDTFDLVICVQNGISAFKTDPGKLLSEAVRVTKKGGIVLFSSYSDKIWEARLEWFKIQAELGLIGEIDMEKTGDGKIVCRDGFTATTYSPGDFQELALKLNLKANVYEVDNSSVFCEIIV